MVVAEKHAVEINDEGGALIAVAGADLGAKSWTVWGLADVHVGSVAVGVCCQRRNAGTGSHGKALPFGDGFPGRAPLAVTQGAAHQAGNATPGGPGGQDVSRPPGGRIVPTKSASSALRGQKGKDLCPAGSSRPGCVTWPGGAP